MIDLKESWKRCAALASFNLSTIAEVLGACEGDACGDRVDAEWWLLVRLHGGCFGVLWGNDGATCSQCGAFESSYASAEFRAYATEAEARASIPVDIVLEAVPA